jgi:tRNA threonylcarbamoyladenosine biosynthesis protein TsaE
MPDAAISTAGGTTPGGRTTGDGGPAATFVAHAESAEDMKSMGASLARLLKPGDTVLLGGELGAGKTTFTQGVAAELGVSEQVTSPTFVLVHSYKTAAGWDLLHADVWRLEHLHEVVDLALPELLEDGAAAVVEWGEMAAPALAPDWLHVAISYDTATVGQNSPTGQPEDEPGEPAGPPGSAGHGPAPAPAAGPLPGAGGRRRLVVRALGPSWQSRVAEWSKTWAGPLR